MAVLKPIEGKWGSVRAEQGEPWSKQTSSKMPLEEVHLSQLWLSQASGILSCLSTFHQRYSEDRNAHDETDGNFKSKEQSTLSHGHSFPGLHCCLMSDARKWFLHHCLEDLGPFINRPTFSAAFQPQVSLS